MRLHAVNTYVTPEYGYSDFCFLGFCFRIKPFTDENLLVFCCFGLELGVWWGKDVN